VRIHSGPGDSVSTKRPDIHTRPNSDRRNCLLDWRSPYTNRSLDGSLKKQRSDIATCATDDRLDGLVNLQWALVNFLADRAERREWEVTKKHR